MVSSFASPTPILPGDIISGQVVKIMPTYVIIATRGYNGLLHIASVSDYYVANIATIFHIGQKADFEVLEVDESKKWLKLSWKSIVPRFRKDPFEYVLEPTKSNFAHLSQKAHEEEEND